jgi:transcription termination/antitermination protein NusG
MFEQLSTVDTPFESEAPASQLAAAHWYAVYVNSRHEKVVARQLEERGIETFLPLYRNWHRWKDRRKLVELALFPSYVFVKIAIEDKLRVLKVSGVVHLVTFNGQLAELPEQEINALRSGLENHVYAEPHPYLRIGRRVRVVRGPMAGTEGILVRKKEKYRVVLSIDVLMRSVAVEVDGGDVQAIGS